MLDGKIKAYVSEKVVDEIRRYLKTEEVGIMLFL